MSNSNYLEENIRLQDAMTKDVDCLARIWEIHGLHIEGKEIPKDTMVEKTFVMKLTDNPYKVGVQTGSEGDLCINIYAISEFSTLEELQKNLPKLFELDGTLYAFS